MVTNVTKHMFKKQAMAIAVILAMLCTCIPLGVFAAVGSVQKPEASVPPGMYRQAQAVALTAEAGAEIYYTTNNLMPTEQDTRYTEPISVSKDTNICAIAIKDGVKSAPVTFGYFIRSAEETPQMQFVVMSDIHIGDELNIAGSGAVLFDTVLYPEQPGANVTVTSERMELQNVTNNGASAVQITILDTDTQQKSDISYYLVHDINQKAVRQFGDYETDARLAYVERDGSGKLVRLIVQDGTYIKDCKLDKDLFRAQEQVPQFGCHLQRSLLELASSAGVELDGLTVLADNSNTVQTVEYNGEKQTFHTSGKYVYFGSAPILEDDSKPDPTPTRPGGTGGSGSGGTGVNRPGSGGIGGGNGMSTVPTVNPQPPEQPKQPDTQLQKQLEGHWAEKEIIQLIADGIVKGDNGSLRLEQPVTRAEFAAMLLRSLGIAEEEYRGGAADVSVQDWFAGVIQACISHGIMNGSDGRMRPNDWITREEMAKMAVSAVEQDGMEAASLAFSDGDTISGWAAEFVAQAVEMGLLNGFEDGSFRPAEKTLREQAMVVAARLRNLQF